jgi:hypothetical protein
MTQTPSRFNVTRGDIILTNRSVIKADEDDITYMSTCIQGAVQVANDAIELPDGLVMTLRKIVLSSYGESIYVSFYKSKQKAIKVANTLELHLSGDALNGIEYFTD